MAKRVNEGHNFLALREYFEGLDLILTGRILPTAKFHTSLYGEQRRILHTNKRSSLHLMSNISLTLMPF